MNSDAASASLVAAPPVHDRVGTTPGRRVLLPLATRSGSAEIFSSLDAGLARVGRPARARSLAEALRTVLELERSGESGLAATAAGPDEPLIVRMPNSAAPANPTGPRFVPLPNSAEDELPDGWPITSSPPEGSHAEPSQANHFAQLADAFGTAEPTTARPAAGRGPRARIVRLPLSDFDNRRTGSSPAGLDVTGAADSSLPEGDQGGQAVSSSRTVWVEVLGDGVKPWMGGLNGGTNAESVTDHVAQPPEAGGETWPPAPRPAAPGKDRRQDEAQRNVEGLSMLEERLNRLERDGTLARVARG